MLQILSLHKIRFSCRGSAWRMQILHLNDSPVFVTEYGSWCRCSCQQHCELISRHSQSVNAVFELCCVRCWTTKLNKQTNPQIISRQILQPCPVVISKDPWGKGHNHKTEGFKPTTSPSTNAETLLRLTQCKHAAATGNAKMRFLIKLSRTELVGPQKRTEPTSMFYSEVFPQAPSQKIWRGRQGRGVGGESATLYLISSRTLHEILSRSTTLTD